MVFSSVEFLALFLPLFFIAYLATPRRRAESDAVLRQLGLLCVVEAGLSAADRRHHLCRLAARPGDRAGAANAGSAGCWLAGSSRSSAASPGSNTPTCWSAPPTRRSPPLHSRADPVDQRHPADRAVVHRAAGGLVPDRRAPRDGRGRAELYQLRRLSRHVPASDRRADHPLFVGRQGADRAPADLRRHGDRRAPLHARLCRQGADRRYAGARGRGARSTCSSRRFVDAWLGNICFAFQIFFDFAGYSAMAIGLGRMLGFQLSRRISATRISR